MLVLLEDGGLGSIHNMAVIQCRRSRGFKTNGHPGNIQLGKLRACREMN